MANKVSRKWIIISVVVVAVGILIYQYWKSKRSNLPAGIVSGNGRIEAKLSDASAKEPLRVKKVLVEEGDLVQPGQVLVELDTSTLEEELAKNQAGVASAREQFTAAKSAIAEATADIAGANADIAGAKADVTSANAAIEQQQSEVELAQTEADRQRRMLAENATSKALFDVRQTSLSTAKATLKNVQAQADVAQARVIAAQAKASASQARAATAQAQADVAQQEIAVALAQVEVTRSRIKDATLVSPVTGRVLYRLVEPGEVLGPGGKALTLVDLTDVYMEIFLPSEQAARLKAGAPARVTVDYEPNASAAAYVSFVSPEAQFTPKQVETRSEREKLMFRVKIQIPPELVTHYIERIKTGVRGVGYVKVDSAARWPDWLEKGLINPTTKTSSLGASQTSVQPN